MLVRLTLEWVKLLIYIENSDTKEMSCWNLFEDVSRFPESTSYYFRKNPNDIEAWLKTKYALVKRLPSEFHEAHWEVKIPAEELLTHSNERIREAAVKRLQDEERYGRRNAS